jgi:hypothetical protein
MSLGVIIDIWQTVMIIALTVVIALSFRDLDRRLRKHHLDVQDTIVSQYAILKRLDDQQAQIDKLALDVDEKCGRKGA